MDRDAAHEDVVGSRRQGGAASVHDYLIEISDFKRCSQGRGGREPTSSSAASPTAGTLLDLGPARGDGSGYDRKVNQRGHPGAGAGSFGSFRPDSRVWARLVVSRDFVDEGRKSGGLEGAAAATDGELETSTGCAGRRGIGAKGNPRGPSPTGQARRSSTSWDVYLQTSLTSSQKPPGRSNCPRRGSQREDHHSFYLNLNGTGHLSTGLEPERSGPDINIEFEGRRQSVVLSATIGAGQHGWGDPQGGGRRVLGERPASYLTIKITAQRT